MIVKKSKKAGVEINLTSELNKTNYFNTTSNKRQIGSIDENG